MKRKVPLRKCIGCGENKDKRNLIRIVKNKEDEFFVDIIGKKNGRGAYVCPKVDCLNAAIKNKGLERSFKCKIPQDIYDEMKKEFSNIE